MAKISRDSQAFYFSDMTAVGIGLVDEFLRRNPKIVSRPSPGPSIRVIEWKTQEQLVSLEDLAKKVEIQDPSEKQPQEETDGNR